MPQISSPQWLGLQEAFSSLDSSSPLEFAGLLALGGGLAIYIRQLYRWTSPSVAKGSIAKVFPLLTMVTIAVITVVKASLALSLGLVGALSIVRFRAAVRDPEELVYLFLCIGVGLSIGALQLWPSVCLVVVASLFALVFDRKPWVQGRGVAFVTLSCPVTPGQSHSHTEMQAQLQTHFQGVVVERMGADMEESHLRAQVAIHDGEGMAKSLEALKQALPHCEVAMINASTLP